jgi:hypothetical protein
MARKKAAPKPFVVHKEWRPRPAEEALKNVYIDEENKYSRGIPAPIIYGKPYNWTLKDHEFLLEIYNSKPKDAFKRYMDYISDGVRADGIDENYDHE